MGKRYHCDYCDRSFKDNPSARKKHLLSLQHINNRMNHYKMYKDPETILMEESGKIPCKRFITNDCMFGESCRFSHYTPQMIMELRNIVAHKQRLEEFVELPSTNKIIQEFFQNSDATEEEQEIYYPQWTYPQELLNYPNLPPSLWPITYSSITNVNFGHWGK